MREELCNPSCLLDDRSGTQPLLRAESHGNRCELIRLAADPRHSTCKANNPNSSNRLQPGKESANTSLPERPSLPNACWACMMTFNSLRLREGHVAENVLRSASTTEHPAAEPSLREQAAGSVLLAWSQKTSDTAQAQAQWLLRMAEPGKSHRGCPGKPGQPSV